MKQRLSKLLERLGKTLPSGVADPEIWRVTSDSREAKPGSLFVAIKGAQMDGHHYARSAWRGGASALLLEEGAEVSLEDIDIPVLFVEDTRTALATLAAAVYGPLGAPLGEQIVGLTGTNGKTSTTYMLESILRVSGAHPGVIGTVNYRVDQHIWPAALTTPPPELLWGVLTEMEARGATHLLMEVSSHALDQRRVDGLRFAVAGFTNLTQDHLDYHGDFETYLAAKARLFSVLLSPSGRAVINADDEACARLSEVSRAPVWTYSVRSDADADIVVISQDIGLHGIRAEVRSPGGDISIKSPLLGAFHLHNLLLAIGVALALGVPPAQIEDGLQRLSVIPGRLERVSSARSLPFEVLVDYAHTPDALEQILRSIRPLCEGRLIVVFGCGGDRDQTKRPLMGAAVAQGADLCFVTSDNPRTEDPQQIIDQILVGMAPYQEPFSPTKQPDAARGMWACVNRREAIQQAITLAQPKDVILIAGKGHEDYQIIGHTRLPFSDREVAREAMNAYTGHS